MPVLRGRHLRVFATYETRSMGERGPTRRTWMTACGGLRQHRRPVRCSLERCEGDVDVLDQTCEPRPASPDPRSQTREVDPHRPLGGRRRQLTWWGEPRCGDGSTQPG